jgi:hypothetical protein
MLSLNMETVRNKFFELQSSLITNFITGNQSCTDNEMFQPFIFETVVSRTFLKNLLGIISI